MNEAVARPLNGVVPHRQVVSVTTGLRQGPLEARIARTEKEIAEAQALRYKIFYGEMGAKPTAEMVACQRDFDHFDLYCEHLLVLKHDEGESEPTVIGTYRLLRRASAAKAGGFYTATEFDISKLEAVRGEIMELGRACVDAAYRNRPTMQLLWRAIATYAFHHDVKIMFGCASLPGMNPMKLAAPLSYLHYNHLAPEYLRARALPHRFIRTDILPPQEIDAEAAVAELDSRAGKLSALPPLIKGYLRIGGMIGEGAIIDPDFQTIDVCIIVVTDRMTEKYFNHYMRSSD